MATRHEHVTPHKEQPSTGDALRRGGTLDARAFAWQARQTQKIAGLGSRGASRFAAIELDG